MGVILLALALVPVSAWVASARQAATYEATARAFLGQGAVPGDVIGRLRGAYKEPVRAVKTQAELAGTPAVASRVLAAVPAKGGSARRLLDDTTISTPTEGDILAFSVRDGDQLVAQRLASEYARQYAIFRRHFDRLPLDEALRELESDRPAGSEPGVQARKLQTLQAVGASTSIGIQPAATAVKIRPQTAQNLIAGLLLGGVFGLGLAFLWEALDSRVEGSAEIASELGLRELAAIPTDAGAAPDAPPAMLDAPDSRTAEAFRFLRAAVQPDLQRGARTLMVTSAPPRDGESTVAANLAIALARAGHDVVLADLNFRSPAVARQFGLEGQLGLADFAVGTATLDDVISTIEIDTEGQLTGGSLRVVPAGSVQVTGEFWTAPAFTRSLEALSDAGALVVLDGPGLLGTDSAAPLARHADVLLLVARLDELRRPSLSELRRVIPTLAAPTIGFVAVGGTARPRHAHRHLVAREVAA